MPVGNVPRFCYLQLAVSPFHFAVLVCMRLFFLFGILLGKASISSYSHTLAGQPLVLLLLTRVPFSFSIFDCSLRPGRFTPADLHQLAQSALTPTDQHRTTIPDEPRRAPTSLHCILSDNASFLTNRHQTTFTPSSALPVLLRPQRSLLLRTVASRFYIAVCARRVDGPVSPTARPPAMTRPKLPSKVTTTAAPTSCCVLPSE